MLEKKFNVEDIEPKTCFVDKIGNQIIGFGHFLRVQTCSCLLGIARIQMKRSFLLSNIATK